MKMSLKNLLIFFVLSALALTATCQVKFGKEAGPNEFKYLVYIEIQFDESVARSANEHHEYIAGGMIISDRWVLTVAHNFDSITLPSGRLYQPDNIHIVAGSKNRDADEGTEGAQIVNVNMAAVTMHPKWRDDKDETYDVALIYLGKKSLETSPTVEWAPLVDKDAVIEDLSDVTIAGWGRDETGYYPVMAHKGDMQIIPSEYCKKTLNDASDPNYFNEDRHLCYGCDEGTCSMGTLGDSGSPVVQFKNRNDEVVIGIHKGSCPEEPAKMCTSDTPGSAQDIRKIRGWIRDEMTAKDPQQRSFFQDFFENVAGAFWAAASAFGFR